MARQVLVTGASSGIGVGIVEVLCRDGFEVHALARRADRLAEIAARTGCETHAVDLTDAKAVSKVMADLAPDVLVNNAGRGGGFGGIASTHLSDVQATVGTNVVGTMELLRLALPGMVSRKSGHVVNIGSVAALYACPSALYGGTKAAIKLLSENLRLELRGSGIRVTDIRPGRVTSEFYDVALNDKQAAARAKATGIRELAPSDIGEAVRFAVTAPASVNVSTIEIQPVEQTYGGFYVDPVQQ